MKNILVTLTLVLGLMSCEKKEMPFIPRDINTVQIKTLFEDSLLNIRALEVDKHGSVFFATSSGQLGSISKENTNENVSFLHQFKHDTISPNFRSLSVTNKATFVLSIISPALLYKVQKDSLKLVYKEAHPKAFYDAMRFWNDQEGIAIGDSVDGCLSIIITRNGGESWNSHLGSMFVCAQKSKHFLCIQVLSQSGMYM